MGITGSTILKVNVLFFASCREITGTREVDLEVDEGITVADLKEHLLQRYPALKGLSSSLSAAVNADYSSDSAILSEGDEIAFLPPVSGG